MTFKYSEPKTIKVLIGIVLSILTTTISAQPANESTILAEFNLDEAETAISEHPNWSPGKVLIMEHPALPVSSPEFQAQLREIAGDVEIIFASGGAPTQSLLQGADAVLGTCTDQLLIEADQSLLWVHNYMVGVERCSGVSSEYIEGRVVTNSQSLSGPSIAEHAITMMLSLARNFPALMEAQRQKSWDRSVSRHLNFGELSGKTVLVAGLGGVGTEVAKRAHGLGMHVIATRNSSRTGPDYVDYVGLAHELNTLAEQADVVVNALPITEQTRDIFNAEFFDALKSNAIFINVGRGESAVTSDLIQALESGKLYGAGLDVVNPEPLPASSPLWTMDNVIITPHMSSAGGLSVDRFRAIVAENLRRYVAGEALLNPVDLERGY